MGSRGTRQTGPFSEKRLPLPGSHPCCSGPGNKDPWFCTLPVAWAPRAQGVLCVGAPPRAPRACKGPRRQKGRRGREGTSEVDSSDPTGPSKLLKGAFRSQASKPSRAQSGVGWGVSGRPACRPLAVPRLGGGAGAGVALSLELVSSPEFLRARPSRLPTQLSSLNPFLQGWGGAQPLSHPCPFLSPHQGNRERGRKLTLTPLFIYLFF